MSKNTKYLVGGLAAAAIALIWLPFWFVALVVIGVPVAAYLMLDPSQRRRLREGRKRRQLGP
ncbi:MAG: hypothetical protein ACRDVZ_04785 [Jiangellaceae bacterium]